MVFNAMKVLFGIDDLRAIGESTAKYYYWKHLLVALDSELVLPTVEKCHRWFQINLVNIEQGEQNCVVPPSICYCQHSQRALL